MSGTERATRASVRSEVFPILRPRPIVRLPTRIWSQHEWELMQFGYQAQSMEEKWDVFAEDGTVFMHRSWTGYGIFEFSFAAVAGGFRIVRGVVESDENRYRSRSDEFDCVMPELIISSTLLNEPATELRERLRRTFEERRTR